MLNGNNFAFIAPQFYLIIALSQVFLISEEVPEIQFCHT